MNGQTMRPLRRPALCAAAVVVACAVLSESQAATRTWTGAGGNNWFTTSSWSPSGGPDFTDQLYVPTGTPGANAFDFNNGGLLDVSNSGTVTLAIRTRFGQDGTGTLVLHDGGRLFTGEGTLGANTDSIGLATVSGSGSRWSMTTVLNVGTAGRGDLLILGGGLVDAPDAYIGQFPTGQGMVRVFGTSSLLDIAGTIDIGSEGTGTLVVEGSSVKSVEGRVGTNFGSFGQVEIDLGGDWDVNGPLELGFAGTADVAIAGGGTFDVTGSAIVAQDVSGNARVAVHGHTSRWDVDGTVLLADEGTARLEVTAGGDVFTGATGLASQLGSSAYVLIDGIGSRWMSTAGIQVGGSGTAIIDVSDGGTINSSSTATVALDRFSQAFVNIVGPGASWFHNGAMTLGADGAASISVEDGGHLRAESIVAGDTLNAFSSTVVQGQGSSLSTSIGRLSLGVEGAGFLSVYEGATSSVATTLEIGIAAGSFGGVDLTGDAMLTVGDDLLIGNRGSAFVFVSDGSHVSVGSDTTVGSMGTLTLDRGSLTTTNFTRFSGGTIDFRGGTMTIDGGEAVFNSSLTFGGEADNMPDFRVERGGDAAVTFSYQLAASAGEHAATIITGVSDDGLRRSTLRGTGGGGGADLIVAGAGTATLTVADGGLADLRDDFVVGKDAGSHGTVMVSGVRDGFRSTIEVNNGGTASVIQLGVAGSGEMSITDGGLVVTTGTATLAQSAGSSASLHVGGHAGGFDATLDVAGNLDIAGTGRTAQVTIAEGGTVRVGSDLNINAGTVFRLDGGTLIAEGDEATIVSSADFQFLSGTFVAETSTFVEVFGGLTIPSSGVLQVATRVDGPVTSHTGSQIVLTSNSRMGQSNDFLGVNLHGLLDVGTHTLELRSASYAQLGELTLLNGGSVTAANGVVLGTGDTLAGTGVVSGTRIAAATGSLIHATDDLFLGDLSRSDGFTSDGVLEVNNFSVELFDANMAVAGSLTHLGTPTAAGTLVASNGLLVDFGRNIEGFGTIDSSTDPMLPTVINGSAVGDSATNTLTFLGFVKGVGTFSNVTFADTFSPGLSPAALTTGNLEFTSSAELRIEIGGTTPGSDFDQLNSTGRIALDGLLNVDLIAGFAPALGHEFEILTATTGITGDFADLSLPALGGGLAWRVESSPSSYLLSIGLAGDFNEDGVVDAADYVVWRKTPNNFGGDPDGHDTWRAHFGEPGGSGSGASANSTVPEPATLVLLMFAAASWCLLRDRAA